MFSVSSSVGRLEALGRCFKHSLPAELDSFSFLRRLVLPVRDPFPAWGLVFIALLMTRRHHTETPWLTQQWPKTTRRANIELFMLEQQPTAWVDIQDPPEPSGKKKR